MKKSSIPGDSMLRYRYKVVSFIKNQIDIF